MTAPDAAWVPRPWQAVTERWAFGAALREVFPDIRVQRYSVHKTANVLAALPTSAHPGAKAALAESWDAEDKSHAHTAAKRFADPYGVRFAEAAGKVTDDLGCVS